MHYASYGGKLNATHALVKTLGASIEIKNKRHETAEDLAEYMLEFERKDDAVHNYGGVRSYLEHVHPTLADEA